MIPGIPDIPDFKGLVTSGTDALISFGGATLVRMIFGNQWGVFNQYGIPVMLADTVHSMKYQNGSQIAQAPIEKGSFASYNKVQNPYQATVTMVRGGGDVALRGAFIAQLDLLSKSTLLFHVVTPEYVHINAAIVGYDYARDPQAGARMIAATIYLEEVREAVVTYESREPKNPEDSPTVDVGEQQPQDANQSILEKVYSSGSGAASTIGDKLMRGFDRFVYGEQAGVVQ